MDHFSGPLKSGFENANVGKLYSAITKFKGYPVNIVEWTQSINLKKPIPATKREFERYDISADNLTFAFKVMEEYLNPNTIKNLIFRHVPFKGISEEFADLLAKFPKLEHLVITDAQMTSEAIKVVIDALPTSLVSLDLTRNECDSKGFEALIKKLPQLVNLKFLDIQIGENRREYKEYNYSLIDFYGIDWGSDGSRKSYNPLNGYDRDKRQIVNQRNTITKTLMDSFKEVASPLQNLEYIVRY